MLPFKFPLILTAKMSMMMGIMKSVKSWIDGGDFGKEGWGEAGKRRQEHIILDNAITNTDVGCNSEIPFLLAPQVL